MAGKGVKILVPCQKTMLYCSKRKKKAKNYWSRSRGKIKKVKKSTSEQEEKGYFIIAVTDSYQMRGSGVLFWCGDSKEDPEWFTGIFFYKNSPGSYSVQCIFVFSKNCKIWGKGFAQDHSASAMIRIQWASLLNTLVTGLNLQCIALLAKKGGGHNYKHSHPRPNLLPETELQLSSLDTKAVQYPAFVRLCVEQTGAGPGKLSWNLV